MSAADGQAILDAQPELDLDGIRRRMAPYQERVEELLRRYAIKRGALLQLLWLVQEEFGWVPRIGIKWAAELAEVSPVHAFGVVEFYTMYRQAPIGRYHIQVCHNVSCHIQGAPELIDHLETTLGVHAGETTADGLFTLSRVECLAMCGNGPGILINDEFLYGPGETLNEHQEGWHASAADLDAWLARLRAEAAAQPEAPKVDSLGGIMLRTAGHPGSHGASAEPLAKTYAPAPPAIKVAARSQGEKITLTFLCAPESRRAVIESSADGASWQAVGELDVAAAPGVPGPPGGPKNCSFETQQAIGSSRHYRVIAYEGSGADERAARASASASITATPVAAAPDTKGDR